MGDTFGSGANAFQIEFVSIGNPGNTADTTGNPNPAGSVPYTYRMGKFEISEQMIDKGNAVGGLGITKDSRGADKPVTLVSWNEAARFVNWLNTNTGSTPAYKFALQPGEVGYSANANIQLWAIGDAGYNPNNLYRNSLARYFLPSAHEWYKAAFYDPTSGVYYNYPTGSDSAPTAVASGTAAGTAVWNQSFGTGPANITLAGGLSPYGTMGQGVNAWEWEETDIALVNDSSSSDRGIRGGDWPALLQQLASDSRSPYNPDGANSFIGFRVASISEPDDLGDYSHDGTVDAADYVVWRKDTSQRYEAWRTLFGQSALSTPVDFNNDATVDAADYVVWRKTGGMQTGYNTWSTNFGATADGAAAVAQPATGPAVPEPSAAVFGLLAMMRMNFLSGRCRRGRR